MDYAVHFEDSYEYEVMSRDPNLPSGMLLVEIERVGLRRDGSGFPRPSLVVLYEWRAEGEDPIYYREAVSLESGLLVRQSRECKEDWELDGHVCDGEVSLYYAPEGQPGLLGVSPFLARGKAPGIEEGALVYSIRGAFGNLSIQTVQEDRGGRSCVNLTSTGEGIANAAFHVAGRSSPFSFRAGFLLSCPGIALPLEVSFRDGVTARLLSHSEGSERIAWRGGRSDDVGTGWALPRAGRGPYGPPPDSSPADPFPFDEAIAWASQHDPQFRLYLESHPTALLRSTTGGRSAVGESTGVKEQTYRRDFRLDHASGEGYLVTLDKRVTEINGESVVVVALVNSTTVTADRVIDPARLPLQLATVSGSQALAERITGQESFLNSISGGVYGPRLETIPLGDHFVYTFRFRPPGGNAPGFGLFFPEEVVVDAGLGSVAWLRLEGARLKESPLRSHWEN